MRFAVLVLLLLACSPQPCTQGSCSDGFVCVDGECHVCGGAAGRPCCDGECGEGFRCIDERCSPCGGRRQYCCPGCDEGLSCGEDGLCHGCGEVDEPCCGGVCGKRLVCKQGVCRIQFMFSEYDTHEIASGAARG